MEKSCLYICDIPFHVLLVSIRIQHNYIRFKVGVLQEALLHLDHLLNSMHNSSRKKHPIFLGGTY